MKEYMRRIMAMDQILIQLRETVCMEMLHGVEVSNMAVLLAKELGESEEFCRRIEVAGVLHDIGKLRLTKYLYAEDGLVIEQMKYVRQHTVHSRDMMLAAGYDSELSQIIYHHHENFDGSGYPDNLRGNTIPWMSRILRVCDVFIALTTDRSYREAFDPESALEIMIDEVGDYDMQVFLAFQRVIHREGFETILEKVKEICSDRQLDALQLFEVALKQI